MQITKSTQDVFGLKSIEATSESRNLFDMKETQLFNPKAKAQTANKKVPKILKL